MDSDVSGYDSTEDALVHIDRVRVLLDLLISALRQRGIDHDASKFNPEEKQLVDREMPLLRTLIFGSPEYWKARERLRPAIDHHNRLNSHHPEHYPDGICGMDLLDLVEMFVDWKAASEGRITPISDAVLPFVASGSKSMLSSLRSCTTRPVASDGFE